MPGPGVECRAVDGLKGTSLVRTRGAGEDVVRHAHRSLVVSAVLSGERVVSARGMSLTAGAGTVLVVEPGMVHSCRSSALQCLTLCLSPSDTFFPDSSVHGLAVYRDPCLSARVAEAWNRLAGDGSAESKAAEVSSLLAAMSRAEPEQCIPKPGEAASPAVRRVRAGLDVRPDMNGTELAGMANMSTWGLNRAFARAYGMPPYSYGMLRRVDWAKDLLAGGMPPAIVAAETGFADQSHFSRTFRRLVGLTPARYARAFTPRQGERS